MFGINAFSVFVFLGTLATLSAQQPASPTRQPYDGADALNAPQRIYIDQDCRILPDPLHPDPGKKQKPYRDDAICYVEGPHFSEHREEGVFQKNLLRWDVNVVEQTFQVSNLSDREALFVVSYPVQKPWSIDSDPKPVRYEDNNAIFLVHVAPGQRVGLHVGRRIMRALKSKPL